MGRKIMENDKKNRRNKNSMTQDYDNNQINDKNDNKNDNDDDDSKNDDNYDHDMKLEKIMIKRRRVITIRKIIITRR